MSDNRSKKTKSIDKSSNKLISFTLSRKVLWSIMGGVVALAIGVGVLLLAVPTKLESAHAECVGDNPRFAEYSSLDDDGRGLFVDGAGEKSVGLTVSDLACVITSVGVPNSVISRMDTTTALMGQQEATFDGITVRWSYHPSNGLDLSFEMN